MCRNHKKTLVVHSLVGHFFPPLPQFFSLSLTLSQIFKPFYVHDAFFPSLAPTQHSWYLLYITIGCLDDLRTFTTSELWVGVFSFEIFQSYIFRLVREDIETTQNFRNRRVMYWCYTCRVPNILFNETCLLKFGHWKQWKSWIASVNSLRGSDSGATLNKDSVRFFRPQCRSTGKNEL